MNMKLCIKCNVEKPIDQFHSARDRKDGRYPYCKTCSKIEKRKTYERSDAHQRAVVNRKYYAEHKEELKKARYYRYSHSEKNKVNQRRYRQTEKYKASQRRYYESKNGRQHYRTYVVNRRAKEAGNGGSYTPEEWRTLCAFYDYHCLACGIQLPLEELSVDHVIPLSKGGTSNIDNLQPLCLPCNQSKNDRIIDYRTMKMVWWQQLPLF